MRRVLIAAMALLGCGCTAPTQYDVLIRGGTVYDGTGSESVVADVAINDDTIAFVSNQESAVGALEIDATGLAVAPGFINMMSWSNESLIEDGKSQSDIRQGVTLEVMGEGSSMGPLSEDMKRRMREGQGDIRYDVDWTSLAGYLEFLERKGVSPNVASFIGATTARVHVIGYDDREPSTEELARMQELVREAMREGALGVASSLVYPPAFFATTDELIALAKAAGEFDGSYATHMRSEGAGLIEAVDEALRIAREAGVRTEIYHLKAAGESAWPNLDEAIAMIEKARADGLHVTADIYTYTAGSAGLNSSMPPWVQDGGFEKSLERMRDPATRRRIIREMNEWSDDWENMFLQAGSPDKVLLVGFKNSALKELTGRTLAAAAELRDSTPEETAMDLILEDGSRVTTVYFTQSEDNLRKKIKLSWVSFCSDSASLAPEGTFLKSSTHPRAYGSFARLLGKYVRDEKLIPMTEAIRKLTSLPASTLKLDRRGELKPGYFADIVLFDPDAIEDHATFDQPHQYATGMKHVFVNGVQVLADDEHTGATPGRFVRGPGWNME